MRHMETLNMTQSLKSCPPYSDGKAIRASFKQNKQNRYALLEAVSSDTEESVDTKDEDDNKYIQIIFDACTGRSDVQIMRNKGGAGNA